MATRRVILEDGDTVVFIGKKTSLSLTDPAGEYGGVSRSYRVVFEKDYPAFELVALCLPLRLRTEELQELAQRAWEN